jgi:arginase
MRGRQSETTQSLNHTDRRDKRHELRTKSLLAQALPVQIEWSAMDAAVFLVPYDCGYYRRRMGLGPERILEAGLKPLFEKLGIGFTAEEVPLETAYPTEIAAAFQLARQLAETVGACRAEGRFPIVLSGNCNAALGTVSGCGPENTGIVWFDAHGEATTPETTVSGFLDGMPISTILGRAWQALARTVPGFTPVPGRRIFLVDGRAAEPAEVLLLEEGGVNRLPKPAELPAKLVEAAKEVKQFYLHVDLDVLDPSVATANQWTPPGGITIDDLVRGVAAARRTAKIGALGMASYDPGCDQDGRALEAAVAAAQALLR